VLINAAAALFVAGHSPSVIEAHAAATQSIDSGAAREALQRLVDVSRRAP
jgi:anthranilate phosphoribosyltransferase